MAYLNFFTVLVALFRGSLILLVLLVEPSVACSDVKVEDRENDTDATENERDNRCGQSAPCEYCGWYMAACARSLR